MTAKGRIKKLEAALAELQERPVCDCHTWPTWSEMHSYIEALERKLAECEREKAELQDKVAKYEHGAWAENKRFREQVIPDLERKLAAAREALILAQKYGGFDPYSDQVVIRAIAAALTEVGEGEEGK